jgi:UDP-2,4-diacetamido-2,4,6-trideoxy-beta-L-altropyranose hydrolase
MIAAMAIKRLLLRADAGTEIGTGHVMRCLALGQAWQDAGGEVQLAAAQLPPGMRDRLAAEKIALAPLSEEAGSTADARATAELAAAAGARWAVVDGYQFSGDYQRALREGGLRVLALDDYGHAGHYWADAVLNQNVHARPELYASREPYVRLLLGPGYALLRREFQRWRGWIRAFPRAAGKVLVTLGGSDPDNVTSLVIAALGQVRRPLEVVVVVGSGNPHLEALRQAAACATVPMQLRSNVTDMPGLMAWADVAVAAGGSTAWELAFMGLPFLTVVLADNQVDLAAELQARDAAVNLGWFTYLTAEGIASELGRLLDDAGRREALGRRGRQLVDGGGCRGVVELLKEEACNRSECRTG